MKKNLAGIKQIFNLINKSGPQINQLYYEGKYINTNEGIANTFNNSFTNIGSELDNETQTSHKTGAKMFS